MAEVARVKTILTGFAGAPGVSTHHFTKTSVVGWDYFAPHAITQVHDAWEAAKSIFPQGMEMEVQASVDILDVDTGEILSTIMGTAASTTGTGDLGYGPLSAGICVTFRTAGVVAGKHVRGRTFLVPVYLGAIDTDGSPTSGALTTADSFGDTIAGVSTTNLLPVVYSRPVHATLSGPTPRLGTTHQITSVTISDKFAVLRSRRD